MPGTPEGFDATVPNISRIYDFMLGGKDNFAADREAALLILGIYPEAQPALRLSRTTLVRAVGHLAGEVGIRQFLDIGSGLPTQQNVHEAAQAIAPDVRVVYVDNDPVVRVHGMALLATQPGVTMIQADLREPDDVLAQAADFLDFGQPIGLLMAAILHFIPDDDEPAAIVERYKDALAPGSHLFITHMVAAEERKDDVERIKGIYDAAGSGIYPRPIEEIEALFAGMEMLDSARFISPERLEELAEAGWGAVGRKP